MTDLYLKPGIELDALIAKKVTLTEPEITWIATMDDGKSAACFTSRDGPFYHKEDILNWLKKADGYTLGQWHQYPPYSTDMTAAWEVVEKMMKYGWSLDISCWAYGLFNVIFHHSDREGKYYSVSEHDSESIPHAICLAVLKAVERKK